MATRQTELGRLLYKIDGDMRPLQGELRQAEGQVVSSVGNMRTSFGGLGTVLDSTRARFTTLATTIRFAAVAALAAAAVGVVRTASTYQQLELQLETVEGSAQRARAALELITGFAKTTPFEVTEITEAWIKLRAQGIQPTEALLTSFGNTASAFGASITDFSEAVIGAINGENERLKQFGVQARIEGDKVTFRFRDMETEVERSTSAIVGFLQTLGETDFAGGMERQADSFEGALSNVIDAAADTAVAFNDLIPILDVLTFGYRELAAAMGLLADGARFLADEFDTLIDPDDQDRLDAINARIVELTANMQAARDAIAGGDDPDRPFNARALSDAAQAELNLLKGQAASLRRRIPSDGAPLLVDNIGGTVAEDDAVDEETQKTIEKLREQWERFFRRLRDQADEASGFRVAVLQRERFDALDLIHQMQADRIITAEEAAQAEVLVERLLNEQLEEIRLERFQNAQRLRDEAARQKQRVVDQELEAEREAMEETKDVARDLGLTFTSAFEDAIIKGEDFRGVLAGILEDLARLATRKLVTEPLLEGFEGVLADIVGGSASDGSGPTPPPRGRAIGGPVPAGLPAVVGERGPEIAVAPSGGMEIITAAQLGRTGGGVTVHAPITVDARGAQRGVAEEVSAQLVKVIPGVIGQAVAETVDRTRRGGSVRHALRG